MIKDKISYLFGFLKSFFRGTKDKDYDWNEKSINGIEALKLQVDKIKDIESIKVEELQTNEIKSEGLFEEN